MNSRPTYRERIKVDNNITKWNLEEGGIRPVTKPVENTTIEKCRRCCSSVFQPIFAGVHREDHVEVLHDLVGEPLVQLLVGVQHQALPLGALLALRHQRCVLVPLEQARNLTVSQQGVHSLEETRIHDIALVEDEANLLIFAATSSQHLSQILIKVLGTVLVVNLDLENGEAVHPGNKSGEGRLARTRHSNEEQVTLGLSEDPVNPEHMVQNLIEEDQGHVKFLLIEDLEPCLGVVSELIPGNRDVVLAQPVAE